MRFNTLNRATGNRLKRQMVDSVTDDVVENEDKAFQAHALDFLGDTLTYEFSFAVIGMSLKMRATAGLAKGVSLTLVGMWVFGSSARTTS